MYGLSNEEKLEFILKTSSDLGITANDYGANTKISTMGAHNILNGHSKNPRTKNLNIMLEYLEKVKMTCKSKVLEKVHPVTQDAPNEYSESLEDTIYNRMLVRLQPEFEKRDKKILDLRSDIRILQTQLIAFKDEQLKTENNSNSASS